MGDKSKMHRKIADNKLMFIGIVVGILFWILEAAIHAVIFNHGRLIDEILAPNPHETWMRSLIVFLFIAFGIYAQFIVNTRKRAEERLQDSEARLRLILETVPSGFFMVDSDRKIVYWNKEAEEIVGLKAGEVIGKDCLEALHCDACKKGCSLFDDKVNKPIYGLECVLHVQGRDITISKNADILKDSRGHTIGGIESFVDITGRKQAEEELRKVNEELGDFANVVSHDLKTPITFIQGFSSFLLENYQDKLEERGRTCLERIEANALRMGALVTDLLALSKIGRVVSTFRDVSSVEIVRNVTSGLQDRLKANGIECVVTNDLPTIHCDGERIYQVFENMLVNAIKYMGDTKRPNIEIGYEDRAGFHEFYVRDNGIGIDPKYHRKIFERFHRLKEKDDEEGTGLGLAIVERIVNNHGGMVWVESEKGKGSTFYFTLPKAS